MTSMFTNCTELLQISLSNIKTEKVEDMSFMFYRCNKLEQLNLSSFNTNNVTTMRGMFGFCNKLNTINFGNNFNTAKVTDMGYMFQGVNSTNDTEIDLDLTGFTFTAGVDITEIFDYTTGPIRVKVTETGYNVLKGISLVNITYVKPDGTPWESNAN